MAINIEQMRAKLEASKNGGARKNDNTKWKPQQGDQTIRIVPTSDGDPFKEFHFHYNVGKNPGILCPKKNHGDDCPICNFASTLWKEGVEKNEDDLKREAKKKVLQVRDNSCFSYASDVLVYFDAGRLGAVFGKWLDDGNLEMVFREDAW